MAKYEIIGPDGERFEVTAPDDMPEADVLASFQSQVSEKKDTDWRGIGRQVLQGLTFGTSDEIGAGIASIPAAQATGNSIPQAYNDIHQSLQDERNHFKRENPNTALAAELGGGLLTGGAGAARLAGAKIFNNLRPALRTAIIGGGEGATYGAASADRGERGTGAAVGAVAGGTLAPATQLGGRVLGNLAAPVVSGAKRAVLGSPGGDARRYLADVLAREGVNSIDDIRPKGAFRAASKATLADVSEGGRGALEGVVSDIDNPNIRKLARETLTNRNASQQGRIFDALDEGMDIPQSATVKDAVASLKKVRGEKAKPLYDAARAKPVQMTDYLKAVFDPEKGVPEVTRALQKATQRVATKRAGGDQISHIDVIDEMKRTLDDDIGALIRQGKNNRARDLIRVKNKILQDVDEQIPEYRQARNAYAGDSALIDAAEQGKKILRQDVDYLDDLLESMSDSEKAIFRLGAKKAVREKLMAAREGTNSVNRIASELNLERIRRAFPDEKAFKAFKDELQFEASIFDTSRVLYNSMTALRQAAQKNMDRGGSAMLDEIGSDTGGIIANALRRLFSRGLSQEAKEELGKILLQPLDDLPDDLVRKMNNTIAAKLPAKQKGQFRTLLKSSKEAIQASPVALPGVATPAFQSTE